QATSAAEVYDPTADTWTRVHPMGLARVEHTATLLTDGTVLVAGGRGKSAETFIPSTNSWIQLPRMNFYHVDGTATLLGNGNVLLTRGASGDRTAERFVPSG